MPHQTNRAPQASVSMLRFVLMLSCILISLCLIAGLTRFRMSVDGHHLLLTSLFPWLGATLGPTDLIDRHQGKVQAAQLIQDAQQGGLIGHTPTENGPVLAAGMHFEALKPFRPTTVQLPINADLVAAAEERLTL